LDAVLRQRLHLGRGVDTLPHSGGRVANRGLGAVAALVGLAFLAGAWMWVAHDRQFRREAVATTGRVIANVMHRAPIQPGHNRAVSYCAVVAYSIAPGRPPVQYEDNLCSRLPSFSVGQSVTVYYDQAKPTRVMIDHGIGGYVLPGAVGVLGLVFLLGGLHKLAGLGTSRPSNLWVPDSNAPTVWRG
jgi:hypothetical protein